MRGLAAGQWGGGVQLLYHYLEASIGITQLGLDRLSSASKFCMNISAASFDEDGSRPTNYLPNSLSAISIVNVLCGRAGRITTTTTITTTNSSSFFSSSFFSSSFFSSSFFSSSFFSSSPLSPFSLLL
ncbi:hypothetical protein L249_0290, partial [Ophiocordyceps polyrhachis-furcata BCC 54312]